MMTRRTAKSSGSTANSIGKVVGGCLVILGIWAVLTAVVAFVVMLAWNAVIPGAFDGPTLDFVQSFALVTLVTIVTSALRTVFSRR